MSILTNPREPGVLPKSSRFFFAPPTLDGQECDMFYYMTWCGHFFCTHEYLYQRKSYPYCLLIYVESGLFHIRFRNCEFNAQAGDVVLLDCREEHCYSAHDELEFYYIHFDGLNSHELCQYLLNKYGPLIRSQNNILIRSLMIDTISYYKNNGYENPMDTSMRVYKFIQLLMVPKENSSEESNPIQKTLQYIHTHISDQLTLKELSGIAHLSTYYYSRLFKKETGLSPVNYILNLRISQAKILLVTTDKSIKEIAYALGYAHGASFTSAFTEKTGCSPRQYRKLMN
ncbi:AraC family transcriptional regulator [Ruminococcus gauvreauii]|uniref:AraC family transcriptional regulator n=1 Tax=Ruminococcus gauvreauii TaxID=438033 RepID=A0ABY5VMN7_9FIRM|nr:AraC family transcriptional regulator [Ruminococcus gauvreauii]UWP61223.1 AraC family transcriptional regulator [Ruminococcus gauvreauii]